MKQTTANSLMAIGGLCACTAILLVALKNNGGTVTLNKSGFTIQISSPDKPAIAE